MRQSISNLCVAVLLATGAALAAQTPAAPAAAKGGDTVLLGCIRSTRADAGNADPKGNVFTLEVTETAATTPSAAPTTSASTRTASAKTTYTLSAPEAVNLSRHLNHQVQLTGRMSAPATTTATPPPANAKPIPGGGGGHRTFEVTALKMIAACPTP